MVETKQIQLENGKPYQETNNNFHQKQYKQMQVQIQNQEAQLLNSHFDDSPQELSGQKQQPKMVKVNQKVANKDDKPKLIESQIQQQSKMHAQVEIQIQKPQQQKQEGGNQKDKPQYPQMTFKIDKQYDQKNNQIQTTQYTLYDFLPKQIFFQISQISNIYFLVNYYFPSINNQMIGVLQIIPLTTDTKGIPTQYPPLILIIMVSMAKAAYENYKHYLSDKKENDKLVILLKEGKHKKAKWEDLIVGDIIKIKENEYFPADVMLIATSQKDGKCFIETKNLDGETNLKQKCADKYLLKVKNDVVDYEFEKPNALIYKFKGTIKLQSGKEEALNNNNIILRGCSLQNTEYIYGVVTYTGQHTKIMRNSVQSRQKQSRVQHVTNKQILLIGLLQMIFCSVCSMICIYWERRHIDEITYVEIEKQYY